MVGVNTCIRGNLQHTVTHSDAVHAKSWCAGQQHRELGPTQKFIVLFSLEVKHLSPIRIHHQSKEVYGEVYGECVRSENGAQSSKMVKWASLMFALVCPSAARTDVSAIQVEEIILQS